MALENSVRRYRTWYARLLRLYSKPFYERFGEGMEQTFNDLLRERRDSHRELLAFALWTFLETSAEIVRENLRFVIMRNKNILRIALATAFLLLIPLMAMQFTKEVTCSLADFVAAGSLLFGAGLTYELVSRKIGNVTYRAAVGLAVGAALMLVWVNLAVGIIGNENTPANLLYVGVLAVGAIGTIAARLRPEGMSRALFATATAQLLAPAIAVLIWKQVSLETVVVLGNGVFVALFAVSALLFRRASASNPR